MYNKRISKGLSVLAAGLLASGMVAAEAPEACVACHNDNGVSKDPAVPTLAGNAAFFIENQLYLFQAGDRPCVDDYFAGKADVDLANHCAALEGMSEEQFAEIGAHYEGLSYAAFTQDVDAGLAAKGEALHMDGCERCHTEAGSVMEDEAGILAGQPKAYMIAQLKHYRAGERPPSEMNEAAEGLSDEDIQALAEFYAREGSRF
ncbi:MAG: hypothetical protein RQ729_06260 [Wenzhouxiangellaceae bacterium]|nr:hypothetical protein [Wenzhouxiangellaceae bacterium]